MRHLREKVREIRAETERNLAAITAAAAEARARRSAQGASGGGPVDPLSPMSPRAAATDGARFQETKAKLQRRLEQLGMQQMRLEQHIAEAAQVPLRSSPQIANLLKDCVARRAVSVTLLDSTASGLLLCRWHYDAQIAQENQGK